MIPVLYNGNDGIRDVFSYKVVHRALEWTFGIHGYFLRKGELYGWNEIVMSWSPNMLQDVLYTDLLRH